MMEDLGRQHPATRSHLLTGNSVGASFVLAAMQHAGAALKPRSNPLLCASRSPTKRDRRTLENWQRAASLMADE